MTRVDARFLKKFKTTQSFNGDGSTTVFNLTSTPQENEAVHIAVNGLLQEEGPSLDYQLSGTAITFNAAPAIGQRIVVTYWKNRGE